MQLYPYFMSQFSEFCRHNSLCCFSTSVYFCCCLFRYWFNPETFGYSLVWACILRQVMNKLFPSYCQNLSGYSLRGQGFVSRLCRYLCNHCNTAVAELGGCQFESRSKQRQSLLMILFILLHPSGESWEGNMTDNGKEDSRFIECGRRRRRRRRRRRMWIRRRRR